MLCLLSFSFLQGPDVPLEGVLDLDTKPFSAIHPGALFEPKFLTNQVKISQGYREKSTYPRPTASKWQSLDLTQESRLHLYMLLNEVTAREALSTPMQKGSLW